MPTEAGAALVDGRVLGRLRSFSGNSQEWNFFKFVFKAYVGVVAPPKLNTMERAADDGSDKSAGGLSEEDRPLRGRLMLLLAQVSGPPMMNVAETAGSRCTASDGSETGLR